MNDAIEKYISNVKKELYHLVPADKYIADLRSNLEEYVHQFPNSTYQNLVEQFGSPENVAAEFINSQKPNSPKEQAKRRKKIRLFVIIALIIIVFLICFIILLSGNRQAYYTDTTVVGPETEVISE